MNEPEAKSPLLPAGRRPRARDIARLVGTSETAVSFALNGKPGISAETCAKILQAVDELGFTPNYAARALTGAGPATVGFVVARDPEGIGSESFFLHFIFGIQSILSARHYALLFQVVETIEDEIAVYRKWKAENRVEGVVLVDLHREDPRPDALKELRLPVVTLGGPDPADRLPSVLADDAEAAHKIIEHLASLGHDRIAYVAGDPDLEHVRLRTDAFLAHASASQEVTVIPTDFSAEAAGHAVRHLLGLNQPPSAIVFENEVLTVAGYGVLQGRGLEIPRDVSVVSFEDSILWTALRPSITALHRDTYAYGQAVAERLLIEIAGSGEPSVDIDPPQLIVRESTRPVTAA